MKTTCKHVRTWINYMKPSKCQHVIAEVCNTNEKKYVRVSYSPGVSLHCMTLNSLVTADVYKSHHPRSLFAPGWASIFIMRPNGTILK